MNKNPQQLAIIETLPDGSIRLVRIMGQGDSSFWEEQFKVALEAIEFQKKYTEMERFNSLHLNLLLTDCIEKGIINKKGISLKPLIIDTVEKEVAATAWRWSKKKKLLKKLEYQYKQTTGAFQLAILSRIKGEAIKKALSFIYDRLPVPLRNMIDSLSKLK